MVAFDERRQWKNWSQSIELRPERTYRPRSLADLKAIVTTADRNGKRVHAVGSGWSFGDVMATNDYFVDTSTLRGILAFSQGNAAVPGVLFADDGRGVTARESSGVLVEALKPGVRRSSRRLVHVKSGTKIRQLYESLNADRGFGRWALPTMGGASGQTIAGAISTGTHGGDFDMAPIADMVQAIHLVDPSGNERWIERGGRRSLCDPRRLRSRMPGLGGRIHQDDKWFNAALVSVGNFGIVYAYVLEVRDQYGISEVNHDSTWLDLKPMLESGEIFTTTRYSSRNRSRRWINEHPPARGREPTGLGIFINPYRISNDYERDSRPDRRVMLVTHAKAPGFNGAHVGPPGPSLWDQIHLIKDFESAGTLAECQRVLDRVLTSLRASNGTGGEYRVAHSVLDTTGGDESAPPVLSIEVAVTTHENKHVQFIDECLRIFDDLIRRRWRQGRKTKFAGGLNLRFTRPTEAYLGMQSPTAPDSQDERFCHIEIITMREQWITGRPIGADYTKNDMENDTEEFTDLFEKLTDKYQCRLHWGQLSRTRRHDSDRYEHFDDWFEIKKELTNNGAVETFDNQFSKRHLLPQADVAFKAANGQYLVAEGGGGRELRADRDRRRTWETFKLIRLGGNRVALRAYDGSYVAAENGGGGPLVANRPHIHSWETFELIELGGGKVALRTRNGQYVCAEGGGGREIVANRSARRGWETFTLEFLRPKAPPIVLVDDLRIDWRMINWRQRDLLRNLEVTGRL